MTFPSFAEFYRAVNGWDPFPWQEDLATKVTSKPWPEEIGIPTGLGKTSCIDIAVWSLAQQAELDPRDRTAPTRIWYVVNRRLLVDAASTHAVKLAGLLSDALTSGRDPALRAVASALSHLSPTGDSGDPMFVSRLRGGGRAGHRPPHPAQPAIICSTVPMFGSRLLFRGFGTGNGMWPIDAALAGTDSLVLLDEAHLSKPLQQLVNGLNDVDAPKAGIPIRHALASVETVPVLPEHRARPHLVALTATGSSTEPFTLGPRDLAHPKVRQRLDAAKRGYLHEVTRRKLPLELATLTLEHLAEAKTPVAAVIFVNSPSTARAVEHEMAKLRRKKDFRKVDLRTVTLTGRLRDIDANLIRDRLLDPESGVASGSPHIPAEDPSIVVIATQTLEVGADLDFDLLVTEMAGVRAITQRLGRLNRLGLRENGVAHLLKVTDDKKPGLYGTEPDELYSRLSGKLTLEGDAEQPHLDLSPGRIANLMGEPHDTPPYQPVLLPAHMWEFAKTSQAPPDEAPPEVFFSGVENPDLTVSICWRSDMPPEGEVIEPRIRNTEVADVPVGAARAFFTDRPVEPLVHREDGSISPISADALRPGMTLVMHCADGRYGPSGWDPDSEETVQDGSLAASSRMIITSDTVENLLGRDPGELLAGLVALLDYDPEEGPDVEVDRAIAPRIADALRKEMQDSDRWRWVEHRDPTTARIDRVYSDLRPMLVWPETYDSEMSDPRFDSLDELSVAPSVDLSRHLEAVGELAGSIARCLGFSESLIEAAAKGGGFHDLGKADRRFQLLLGNTGLVPLAKSNTSMSRWNRRLQAASWPRGGRHEIASVQILENNPELLQSVEDPQLVEHMVVSHHGHGRPLVPSPGTAGDLDTTLTTQGGTISALTTPSKADWTQPDRFADLCERYGYWGLALLEATVRQADHVVSQVTEVN